MKTRSRPVVRDKQWAICRRLANGTLECIRDSMNPIRFSSDRVMTFSSYKNVVYHFNTIKARFPHDDIFITRFESKKCPIKLGKAYSWYGSFGCYYTTSDFTVV